MNKTPEFFPTQLDTSCILVENRVRKDLGNIDELAKSIAEHGLIQPLVLATELGHDEPWELAEIILVAGGRRLEALKRLNVTVLQHGVHYIWRDENAANSTDRLRLAAVELEENLRRKDLSWQEQIAAKQRLFDMMVAIHGPASRGGQSSVAQQVGAAPTGFGVRKLAAMLGESISTTSTDLELARAIATMPTLKSAETKSAAQSRLKLIGTLAVMSTVAKAATAKAAAASPGVVKPRLWTLHKGDFRDNAPLVDNASVDLIVCDPPYGGDTDKTVNVEGGSLGQGYVSSFDDSLASVEQLVNDLAIQSYRVLRPDRYAFFFFGFQIYRQLVGALGAAGFQVDLAPFIWIKDTRYGHNPQTHYMNNYEPVLVCRKGDARLVRQAQLKAVAHASPKNRLHFVEKPLYLIQRYILDTTIEGATVLDWCAGTGTTGEAAVRLRRRAILFEREPSMAALAEKQLEVL